MNILIIFSDQQHKYALGKRDISFITPNLDKLSDDGILFKNAYSPNPVCGPFRACLMSGQYSSESGKINNGDPIPENAEPLAVAMKTCGYETAYVGKYHLGDIGNTPVEDKFRKGFDYFSGYQCHNGFNPAPPFNNEVLFWDEKGNKKKYNIHRTMATTKEALNTLDTLNKSDKPFFLMVSYQAPHYPEQPLPQYSELYENVHFKKRPDYIETDPYTPTYSPYSPRPFEKCPDYQNYGNNMDKYKKLYAALCTQVDQGVGEIVKRLKEQGKYEDTLIIYMSDHGDMQGSKGLKNKCLPYEMSAGIPFIVKYPKGRKGEISEELISGIDIYPTCISAAKGKIKTKVNGKSLVDYLKGITASTQDFVISEFPCGDNAWRMIRSKSYKLITDLNYNPKELFNLINDPYEMTNLLKSESMENKVLVNNLISILKKETKDLNVKESSQPQNT